MASISSLEFESKIVVSRSSGAANLGELKKWVITPLFVLFHCTSHLFCHEIQAKENIGKTGFGGKVTFYLMSSTYSDDYEIKQLNIAKKMVAKVLYVPYVNFDSVIRQALSDCDENMMVVNSDSNTTAMRACAFIGKHLNQRAIDIEANMRTSEVVDFKVKGSSKEWIKISKQYQLSTSSKFINEKAGVVVGDEAKEGWEEEEEGDEEEEEEEGGEEEDEGGEEEEKGGGEEEEEEEEEEGDEEEEEEEGGGEEEEEEEEEEGGAKEEDEGGEGGEEEEETKKRGKRNAQGGGRVGGQVTKPGKEQRLRSDFEATMAAKGMCCGCGAKPRIQRFTCKLCDRGYCDDGSCFEQRGEFGCHCAGGIIPMTKDSDRHGSGGGEEQGGGPRKLTRLRRGGAGGGGEEEGGGAEGSDSDGGGKEEGSGSDSDGEEGSDSDGKEGSDSDGKEGDSDGSGGGKEEGGWAGEGGKSGSEGEGEEEEEVEEDGEEEEKEKETKAAVARGGRTGGMRRRPGRLLKRGRRVLEREKDEEGDAETGAEEDEDTPEDDEGEEGGSEVVKKAKKAKKASATVQFKKQPQSLTAQVCNFVRRTARFGASADEYQYYEDCFNGNVPGFIRSAGQALLTSEEYMALPPHSVSYSCQVYCAWLGCISTLLYR